MDIQRFEDELMDFVLDDETQLTQIKLHRPWINSMHIPPQVFCQRDPSCSIAANECKPDTNIVEVLQDTHADSEKDC